MKRTTAIAISMALTVVACSDDTATPPTLAPLGPGPTAAAPTTTITTTSTTTSGASPTTTTAVTTAVTIGPSTSSVPAAGLYTPVAGPRPPDATTAIDPRWIEANGETLAGIADGVYWGTPEGVGTSSKQFVDLHLVQAFFDEACTARFGTGDDACNNDYGIVESPAGSFPAFVDARYVSVVDEATKQNYLVDGPELFALVSGRAPAATAPTDFFFVPFPFLVTVKDGTVISLEQVWVP